MSVTHSFRKEYHRLYAAGFIKIRWLNGLAEEIEEGIQYYLRVHFNPEGELSRPCWNRLQTKCGWATQEWLESQLGDDHFHMLKNIGFLMTGKTATDVPSWGEQCKAFIMEKMLHSFFMNGQCGRYQLWPGSFKSKLLLKIGCQESTSKWAYIGQKCRDAGAR